MTEHHTAPQSGLEPSRVVEVERKYDVDDATPLPEWVGVPGVDAVSSGEVRELDARYFDTADAGLSVSYTHLTLPTKRIV